MKKKKQPAQYIDIRSLIGDKFDDTVWSLETVTYQGNSRFSSFGTGFLFSVKFNHFDRIFLVSNKHVLVEDNPFALILHLPHTEKHSGLRYPLYPTRNVSPVTDSLHDIVVAHDQVDLAIIDVSKKIPELKSALAFRNFKIKPITIKDVQYTKDIEKGKSVGYLGFPDNCECPVIKDGSIRLNPKLTSDVELDIRVAKGASGSPAFTVGRSPSGEARAELLGVIYGTGATEIVPGHVEYDQGHAVKVEHLKDLIYAALYLQGYSEKDLKKLKWY